MRVARCRLPLLLAAAAALAACAPEGAPREAGAPPEAAGFGAATETNIALLAGQRPYVDSLARRFAAEVPTTVTFDFDSALLDAEARAVLDAQAAWMRRFPELRFSVYGHTDLVGPERYNDALGARRARAVVEHLVARGVERSRLDALVSRGMREPLVPVPGPERANRRAVTEVSGFDQRHPAVLNGKYAEVVFRDYVGSAVPLPPETDRRPLPLPGQ